LAQAILAVGLAIGIAGALVVARLLAACGFSSPWRK
jgi:hypothetical protein